MNWSRIFIGDICTVVCFLSGKLNSIFDGIYIMNGLKVLHHTNTNLLELIVQVSFFKPNVQIAFELSKELCLAWNLHDE